MKNLFVLLIFSLFLLVKCKDKTEETLHGVGYPLKTNYILSYTTLDSLSFRIDGFSSDTMNYNAINLGLSYKAGLIYKNEDSDMTKKNAFLHYAKLYKDTSFNRPFTACFSTSPCILDTISRIDISCNTQYDDVHAIGEILNNIVKIRYFTAKEYIENHYTSDYQTIQKEEVLAEFNKNAHYLIGIGGGGISLFFLSPPKTSGEYTFTVKCLMTNGKTFSYQFKPILLRNKKK